MSEFGRTLDAAVIERGLRELNPGIHFDMGTKLNQWHPYQSTRQGVFYNGNHICSMDRGLVPEYKQWSVERGYVNVDRSEWDNEEVRLFWEVVPSWTPGYVDLCVDTLKGKLDDYSIRADGHLIHLIGRKVVQRPGRIVFVGWRHTFARLVAKNIPNVTLDTLAAKFGVDMLKYPIGASGTPEEMLSALYEE